MTVVDDSPSTSQRRAMRPLAALVVVAIPVLLACAFFRAPALKGVGTWGDAPGAAVGLATSEVGWFYTWTAAPPGELDEAGGEVEFVPMIWGAADVNAASLAAAQEHGPYLLGFNEPDRADQANMSVQQALDLWPQMMAAGTVLGSPAVASDAATPGSWLDWFMVEAERLGYRVDFIALHHYSADFGTEEALESLLAYLEAVHDRYGLPIWLTEYALLDHEDEGNIPTTAQAAAYAAASVRALEEVRYVDRYAWFSLTSWELVPTLALYDADGTETDVGEAYRRGEVPADPAG